MQKPLGAPAIAQASQRELWAARTPFIEWPKAQMPLNAPALAFYLEHCEKEFAQSPRAPYWAHAHSCKSLLKNLEQAWDSRNIASAYIRGDK